MMRAMVDTGVVAIVRLDSSESLTRVADAIAEGGVRFIEFTMTTPGALEVLGKVSERFGDDVIFGAGTVLDAESARAAILAGARFVVAPNLNPDVITLCNRYSVPSMPGVLTPTEIMQAWDRAPFRQGAPLRPWPGLHRGCVGATPHVAGAGRRRRP